MCLSHVVRTPCHLSKPPNATYATRQRIKRYRRGLPKKMNTLGWASHDVEEVRGHALRLRHPHHEALASLPSHRFLTWGITRHMRKIRIPRPVYSIRCHKFPRLNAEGCRARGSRYPQVEGSVRDETTQPTDGTAPDPTDPITQQINDFYQLVSPPSHHQNIPPSTYHVTNQSRQSPFSFDTVKAEKARLVLRRADQDGGFR